MTDVSTRLRRKDTGTHAVIRSQISQRKMILTNPKAIGELPLSASSGHNATSISNSWRLLSGVTDSRERC